MREDAYVTAAIERTKNPPWGLEGGGVSVPSIAEIALPDGSRKQFGKATRLHCPKGSTLELHTGGGGGYGNPAERDPEAVLAGCSRGVRERGARTAALSARLQLNACG